MTDWSNTFDDINLGSFDVDSPTTTTTTDASTEDTKSGGFFSGIKLKDLIDKGFSVLQMQSDMSISEDNKDAIKGAVDLKNKETETNSNGSNGKKDDDKSKTITYVVFGLLGVSLIGGIIYFATKK